MQTNIIYHEELCNPFVELYEQELFLTTLHHDNHNGYIIRMSIDNKEDFRSYANKSIKSIKYNGYKHNVYVSLNSFRSNSRVASNVHSINCIYYDLDMHNGTDKYITDCIENTLKIMNAEFEADRLPKPTMITNTGRGLGLFYVLEKSIANTNNTQKSIRFWKYIYTSIAQNIKNVLAKHSNVCELDTTSIADMSRIVRMPLTYNINAKKVCYLEQINILPDGNALYYNLNDLSKYCKDYKNYDAKEYTELRKSIKKNKIVNFEAYKKPFLSRRMQKLEMLQTISNDKCTNKRREYMCFAYYNAAKQIYPNNARNLLYVFNEGFNEPLSLKELEHTMKSVDVNKAEYGDYEGYYKLTDKTIIEKLDLDDEELKATGFGVSYRKIKREKQKEENKNKKEKRNKLIVELILEGELTYKQISEIAGVSEKTVKRVAKEYGVGRYTSSANTKLKIFKNEKNKTLHNENDVKVKNQIDEKCAGNENNAIVFFGEQKGQFLSESLYGVPAMPVEENIKDKYYSNYKLKDEEVMADSSDSVVVDSKFMLDSENEQLCFFFQEHRKGKVRDG